MTPEYAQELIDGIDPRNEYHMWGYFPRRYDPHTVYDALEDIARMHHEYVVQVTDEDGDWVGIDDKGLPTYDYGKITRHKSRRAAMEALNDLPFPAMQSRIVRRLVTDEEVVG